MDALTYICTKWGVHPHDRSPVEIPNVGRNDLPLLFRGLEFQVGAEIGVERGLFSEVLCQGNPGVQLHCVDAWQAYSGYRDHVSQTKLNGFYEEAQARLKPYRAQLWRGFSLDMVKYFPDASLDFVYIDGNHEFQHVVNDLAEWSKKVRPGGIIAGHDYARHDYPHQIQVVPAVQGWVQANDIAPWFLLGRQAKVEGEVRDDARSFFWVNEPREKRSGRGIKQ